MGVELTDEARRVAALWEEEADVAIRDCVIDDEYDRVLLVVAAGDIREAVGPGGETVRRLEDDLGRDVKLVEDAPTAEGFVANALSPAAVYNVTISENDDTVAYVEVAEEDRGVAIGSGGRNVDAARLLARRHFDLDGVELT